MRYVFVLGLLLLCHAATACAASRGRVQPDPVTASTVLDGDATGLVEGCGNQPIVGFTYCRAQEGTAANQSIWFIGPPAKCEQAEACVFIKVWDGQGQLVWGGSIPKGQTRVGVPWVKLLSGPVFELAHRGFWTWNMQVYWLDPEGKERVATSQGDIVVRVYRKGYLPLNEVASDPNFVWSWYDGKCEYRLTAGLRAYVKCGRL
jgi:hypothetical protein